MLIRHASIKKTHKIVMWKNDLKVSFIELPHIYLENMAKFDL